MPCPGHWTQLSYAPARSLVKKAGKSQSGVLVVTVLTSPQPTFDHEGQRKTQRFSCQWNCYYCPNEPGQPRSYLHDEPSVLRANQNGFDPVLQFTERVRASARTSQARTARSLRDAVRPRRT